MISSMAANKKDHQRPSGVLSCFGFAPKAPSSADKPRKSGVRKKFLSKLCLPNIRIINSISRKRKRVSLDAKVEETKGSQLIKFEASKVENMKLQKSSHAPKAEEPKGQKDQFSGAKCHKGDSEFKPNPRPRQGTNRSIFSPTKTTKDSLIGVSIMATLLIIMSIWGRLCAILCMSAWFYCVPLLRAAMDTDVVEHENTAASTTITDCESRLTSSEFKYTESNLDLDLDMSSKMHKTKVVLEGLLQRDHKLLIGKSFS